MNEDPRLFLPLYRWVEAAGSLAPDRTITHPWRWAFNTGLTVLSHIWRFLRWVGDLAVSASGDAAALTGGADVTGGVAGSVSSAVGQAMPFLLAGTLAVFLWKAAGRKGSFRENLRSVLVSLVFLAAAASTAALSVPERVLELFRDATDGVTEPALDYSAGQLESLTRSEDRPAVNADPLGCEAYTDELRRRASVAHPLLRTMSVWMEWSYLPHWRHASYGVAAGDAAGRVYCRSLETAAGSSPAEQAELTVCAVGRALYPDVDDPCGAGSVLLSVPEGNAGPFRPRWSMTDQDRRRHEAAWVVCHSTDSSGQWRVNPAVSEYEIAYRDPVSEQLETETLGGMSDRYGVCRQWMTGLEDFNVHVCPPWSGGAGSCYRPANSLVSDLEPSTDVTPTGRVFALNPSNLVNWNTHPAGWLPSGSPERPQQWEETRTLIINVSSGGAGVGEMFALFLGFWSAMFLIPIVVGLAGGVAASELIAAFLLAVFPLLVLAGAVESWRARFLVPAVKLLAAAALAKVVLLWVMVLYSLVFWLTAQAVPFSFDTFPGMVWAAATPAVATGLFTLLARTQAMRDFVKGDVTSVKGLVRVGAGGQTAAGETALRRVQQKTAPVKQRFNRTVGSAKRAGRKISSARRTAQAAAQARPRGAVKTAKQGRKKLPGSKQ